MPSADSQRLSAVVNSVAEAIIATDHEGNITLINPAAEKLFLVTADQAIGTSLRKWPFNPALGGWLDRAIEEKRAQPLVFELEIGPARYFSVSLAPVRAEDQQLSGWVAVLQDVTHFKQIEQWRSEAVQTAAHDLRNPLNLMVGAVNLLKDSLPQLTPEQAECLAMLQSGMERMGALIEQLLNLEHVEASQDITMSRVTLRRILRNVVEEFRRAAEEKNLQLEFEGPTATAKVLGDESWLRRAVVNLVGNAIKYTPPGGRVWVRYHEADRQGIVEVTDTGPGIPAAAQSRLFERFYRVRNAATRNAPGTGLGLAIVKAIIERHSGRVWVSSEEGKGSTFGFSVPLVK
jgi:two-component system phosphate regulon sensor histidine kinase PhoR